MQINLQKYCIFLFLHLWVVTYTIYDTHLFCKRMKVAVFVLGEPREQLYQSETSQPSF